MVIVERNSYQLIVGSDKLCNFEYRTGPITLAGAVILIFVGLYYGLFQKVSELEIRGRTVGAGSDSAANPDDRSGGDRTILGAGVASSGSLFHPHSSHYLSACIC